MKLLLDANLSPQLLERLAAAGHEVAHVNELGLSAATDEVIFERAAAGGWVVVRADSDFSMLLAARAVAAPSVVLLRHVAELLWHEHLALLVANLPAVAADLDAGVVVSLSPTRLAVRRLPIQPA